MYLLWDIQQMAKVALVMLWVIALHIFPDPLFMYRVAGKDGTEVAEYWCQQVRQAGSTASCGSTPLGRQ